MIRLKMTSKWPRVGEWNKKHKRTKVVIHLWEGIFSPLCLWNSGWHLLLLNTSCWIHKENGTRNTKIWIQVVSKRGGKYVMPGQETWGGGGEGGVQQSKSGADMRSLFFPLNYPFLLFKKHLYWSIIALQCCVSFCYLTKWISYMYTNIPISPPSCVSFPPFLSHPSRSSQSTELISLCYAAASH